MFASQLYRSSTGASAPLQHDMIKCAAQVAPTATTDDDAAVDFVEQLLEAYFMQVRLLTLQFNAPMP